MSRITQWNPEDNEFWEKEGKCHARRNLWISIPALLLAFSVWVFWGMIIVYMGSYGFPWSKAELLAIPASAGLWGAIARIPNTFAASMFGGKNMCIFNTVIMIIPCYLTGVALQDPTTPLSSFILYAALSGFGGGAFASSMSNISFFYPKRLAGTALGLNAGLGNLGVSVAQFVVPLAIAAPIFGSLGGPGKPFSDQITLPLFGKLSKELSSMLYLQNAALIWIPLLIIVALAAFIGMDNLQSAKASFAEQAVIFKRKHNWIMTILYVMTFGSFIGFSFALPQLINIEFDESISYQYAFLGALIGSLARPIGGVISDKFGGAKITLIITAIMIFAPFGIIYFTEDATKNFMGFLLLFLILFGATGIGNASTFRMIAIIFPVKEAGPVLGWTSAIAAFGAWAVPSLFKWSIATYHSANMALYIFVAYYVICYGLCWWYYGRKNAEIPC